MRVADEWSKDGLRYTVFIMNGKYSLKAETSLLEQTYKFRDGQISSVEQLKSILTEDFYKSCKLHFLHMDLSRGKLFTAEESDMSFPEII